MNDSRDKSVNPENISFFAASFAAILQEPVLFLDQNHVVLTANEAFLDYFKLKRERFFGKSIIESWEEVNGNELLPLLEGVRESENIQQASVSFSSEAGENILLSISANKIPVPGEEDFLILLSVKPNEKTSGAEVDYRKFLNEILEQAPAMICSARGPEHVIEVANQKYLQLVGNRDIIGKPAREALPEVENQGFFEILDEVYSSGKAYTGEEVPIQLLSEEGKFTFSYLDFLYKPTLDSAGNVMGIFVHAVDVTEKVEARKKLEESERRLRQLVEAVPAIIWIANDRGQSIYLNQKWCEYTGQKTEDAKGRGWIEAVHPEDREKATSIARTAAGKREGFSLAMRLRKKNGQYRWVVNTGSPKFSVDGTYEGMIGTVVDVHEEKKKEEQIKEKEHRLRNLVEEATVATAVYAGKDLRIELANEAMIKLWGKDRSVLGVPLKDALPELEGQPFLDLLKGVYETGKIYWGKEDKVDLMINNKLQTGYFNFTYKPLRNEEGEIYGILNMAIDVTEMVQSRNLIIESEAHFRQMADLMPEKVANTDGKGKPIYFNRGWLDFSGMSIEELKKNGIAHLIHPEEKEKYEMHWKTCLRTGESFEMEFRCLNRKGGYRWHLSRAEPVRNKEGQIKRWISTTTEIQKIKEEEKKKEDFLKMVSHELKTPVTSIKGYVQLLLSLLPREGDAASTAVPLRPSLERINNQVGRLTRLISEMLDLSRLEENKLELQKEVFCINDLVIQTVQDIRLTNTQHEIEVFHDFKCEVLADRDRIGQVLINFITNAIKYSPESQHIEVRVLKAENELVRVSVRDQGIGIDKKNHKKIFRRFYRVGGKSEETYSGFGIGLHLAKEIMERHNSHIEVESSKGKGSVFSLVLPVVGIKQLNNGTEEENIGH